MWAAIAVAGLAAACAALACTGAPQYDSSDAAAAALFSGPLVLDKFAFLIRAVSLCGSLVFVFFSWDEVGDEHAAEYHYLSTCLLITTSGVCPHRHTDELVTLFLALRNSSAFRRM